jgi:hypothetical protein
LRIIRVRRSIKTEPSASDGRKNGAKKTPDKVLKIAKDVQNRAKHERRFFCEVCEQPFASAFALQSHETSQAPPPRAVLAVAASRAAVVESKELYCQPCDKAVEVVPLGEAFRYNSGWFSEDGYRRKRC